MGNHAFLYFILATSHAPTSHNRCDGAKMEPTGGRSKTLWASYLTAPLHNHTTIVGQSGRQGAKEASSFIHHWGGLRKWGGVGSTCINLSFPRLFLLAVANCGGGEEEDGERLGWPTGTEIKKNNGKANQNWVPYLHPFFFMMFPSTTSALRGRERRGSRVQDFENRLEW